MCFDIERCQARVFTYQACCLKYSTEGSPILACLCAAFQVARREVHAGLSKTRRTDLPLLRRLLGIPGGVTGGLTPWIQRHHVLITVRLDVQMTEAASPGIKSRHACSEGNLLPESAKPLYYGSDLRNHNTRFMYSNLGFITRTSQRPPDQLLINLWTFELTESTL